MSTLLLAAVLSAVSSAQAAEPDPAWLVGQWRGGEGGRVYEERWEPALGGVMLGTFRFVQDGEVRFYELMTIGPASEGDGSATGVALRIKHFGADLVGWEAQDAHVGFRLTGGGPDELVFTGQQETTTLRYRREGDQLTVRLEKADQTSTFTFTRVP